MTLPGRRDGRRPRPERHATAARRAGGRACSRAAARPGCCGSSTATTRPGAGRARRGRHGEDAEARGALAEPARRLLAPLPRDDVAPARPPAAPLRSRGAAASRSSSNQDGVAYPGWAGDRTEALNVPLRAAVQAADHVVYQSAFSKRSSDLFLGEPRGHVGDPPERRRRRAASRPAPRRRRTGRSLLLGGDQTQAYRLELGLETLRRVLDAASGRAAPRQRPARLRPRADDRAACGLHGAVELRRGGTTQADAPALIRGARTSSSTRR